MQKSDIVRVGRVVSVAPTEIGVELTAGPGPENGEQRLSIGGHVMAVQNGTAILGYIHRMEGERAWITPMGEVVKGRFTRGVARYPSPGAAVAVPDEVLLERLFGDQTGERIALGEMPLGEQSVSVGVNPKLLYGRHLAIVGQSGAGKSWAVANVLQRTVAALPNAHVVLLDLHGEYWWKKSATTAGAAFAPETVRGIDARDLELPYWILTFAELVDVIVDRNDPDASTQIAFLRDTVEHLRTEANPDLKGKLISVDTPVYFSLQALYDHIDEANSRMLDFGKTKGPLFGRFDQLLLRFESRMSDSRYAFLFQPKRRMDSSSLEGLLRDFVGLGARPAAITIIDMSGVPFDVRPTVCAQVGRIAFEFNYWNPRRREFPLFLVCEEAHAYVPREAGGPYEGARRSMNRIAREGRKYGVGLCVVSQRPRDVSETVLAQCGNFLCLRLTNPDDQAYVRALVPEGERSLMDALPSLRRGEVIALGEALEAPTRFRLYRPNPTPQSKDVDFGEGWKIPAADLDVADIVDRWRWQRR